MGSTLQKSQFYKELMGFRCGRGQRGAGRGEGAERVPDNRSAGAHVWINSRCRHLLRNTFPAPHGELQSNNIPSAPPSPRPPSPSLPHPITEPDIIRHLPFVSARIQMQTPGN